jgi:hypothetical protein
MGCDEDGRKHVNINSQPPKRAGWGVGVETGTANLAEMVAENVTGFLTQSQVNLRNELSTTYCSVSIELLLMQDKSAGQLIRFAFILALDNVDGKEETWTKIFS